MPAEPRLEAGAFRAALLSWYDRNRRDLPWRRSTAFYPVWISETMLQQTRVEAVIPHFLRFLDRFPDVASLAAADEPDVLAAWSGLGYYSRARNLHRAAKMLAAAGIPADHGAILALPGVGPYTAAAVASIACGLPYAAVDGNVVRVASRLSADDSPSESPAARRRFAALAGQLLDRARPGDFNQAVMELGATVCTPRAPRCGACPVARFCAGAAAGIQESLPVRRVPARATERQLDLVLPWRTGPSGVREVFLVQRDGGESRLAGFWEPPAKPAGEPATGLPDTAFTHRIVNDRYRVRVWTVDGTSALDSATLAAGNWFAVDALGAVPLGGVARKAILGGSGGRDPR